MLPAAIISATIVNCTPGRKGPAAKIEDFLPSENAEEPKPMTAADMKALFDTVIIPRQKMEQIREERRKVREERKGKK